ncbi:hypothetical protein SPHINGOAX6_70190 [Sphingomonas sp. AX6]|nr:hypothetical protein SPHINGOAX6_70190 [Sphingomonas sp. AX6]
MMIATRLSKRMDIMLALPKMFGGFLSEFRAQKKRGTSPGTPLIYRRAGRALLTAAIATLVGLTRLAHRIFGERRGGRIGLVRRGAGLKDNLLTCHRRTRQRRGGGLIPPDRVACRGRGHRRGSGRSGGCGHRRIGGRRGRRIHRSARCCRRWRRRRAGGRIHRPVLFGHRVLFGHILGECGGAHRENGG